MIAISLREWVLVLLYAIPLCCALLAVVAIARGRASTRAIQRIEADPRIRLIEAPCPCGQQVPIRDGRYCRHLRPGLPPEWCSHGDTKVFP